MSSNSITHFLFDNLDIRGRYIRLDSEWQKWLGQRHYREAANKLLGESVAFLALTASEIKTEGRLTLQLRGTGKVKTLVVQCQVDTEDLKLRGMIDAPNLEIIDSLPTCFADGDLALTLYNAKTQTDYQSLVVIEGNTSAEIFGNYLSQSVQHPTQLWFSCDEQQLTGLLIEKMPNADVMDEDGWNRINHLINSLSETELATWSLDELLHRLFHEEKVIGYQPLPVVYHCPDERQRVAELIRSFGKEECDRILDEHGKIIVHNDICDKSYVFNVDEINDLFNHTIH